MCVCVCLCLCGDVCFVFLSECGCYLIKSSIFIFENMFRHPLSEDQLSAMDTLIDTMDLECVDEEVTLLKVPTHEFLVGVGARQAPACSRFS